MKILKKKLLSVLTAAAVMLGSMTAYAESVANEYIVSVLDDSDRETAEDSLSTDRIAEAGTLGVAAEDFEYEVSKDGESVTVTGYVGEDKNVAIPEEINGKKVTEIADNAFGGNTLITSVNIPTAVTKIGNGVFDGCSALEKIVVDKDNVAFYSDDFGVLYTYDSESESIYESLIKYPEANMEKSYSVIDGCKEIVSMSNCPFLKYLVLSRELEIIHDNAFRGCTSLEHVGYTGGAPFTLPANLKYLGEGAFANCSALWIILLPGSITEILSNTFYNCTSLASVEVPKSITQISDTAFDGCDKERLEIYALRDTYAEAYANEHSIRFAAFEEFDYYINENLDDTVMITGYHGTGGDVIIPETIDGKTVTAIGGDVFYRNPSVTSVTIPDTVKSIGDRAFGDCTGLINVDMPEKMTSIESGAFAGCSKLKSIDIPNGITEIPEKCFYLCDNLTSISLPNSLTKINGQAFCGCKGLACVDLPNSLTEIGSAAFDDCGLTRLTIPNSVTEIKKYAFGCANLKNIIVGSGVEKIGAYAFSSSHSTLEDITFLGSNFEMPVDAIAQFVGYESDRIFKPITVYANKGTAAEAAAKRLGYTFSTLDGSETVDYSGSKDCTEVTAGLYNAYSDFLTEYYIEKFPEASLEAFSCTDEEHEFFKVLTKTIIEENHDTEAPEALYNWMNANIESNRPNLGQFGYPIDVYRYKSAHCMGNAYLLCELMRCAGIPAVVALGYVADMKNIFTERDVFSQKFVGHAWVFYYYNNMWNVADSAMDIFTSDKEEIANRYYIEAVDGLTVKSDYSTPLADGECSRLVDNGSFSCEYIYGGGHSVVLGSEGLFSQWSDGSKNWADNKEPIENLFGEEGWVFESGESKPNYLMKNGLYKNRNIIEKDGKTYWLDQTGAPFDVTGLNISMFSGCPLFKVGDKFKLKYFIPDDYDESYHYTFEDYNPNVLSVDSEGNVTIVGEGGTWIQIRYSCSVGNGYGGVFELFAYDPKPYKTTGLTAVSNSGKVTLSWNKMTNANYYVIKRLADGVWIDERMVSADDLSVELSDLQPDMEYVFSIDTIGDFRYESNDQVTVIPGQSETTFTYIDNTDGTITITGGYIAEAQVMIPEEIDGKKVTGIADSAFDRFSIMKTVTVPETVVFIGENALGFDALGELNPNFKLKGYEGSAAHAYAIRYDIPFEIIGKASAENLPFKDENKKEEVVETDIDVSQTVRPEDRITGITINPAFNMKNKDESGVGLDLTKIKVKAKEIYNEDGLKRAEEALGTELIANKHYNLLDLALVMYSENTETDISDKYAGLVEVTIPIPTGHRNKTFYCYRINEDGTKEIIPGIQTKDSYIVYLEHFSLYAFVADEPDETTTISVDIEITNLSDVDTLSRTVVISGDGINDKLVEIIDGKIDISGILGGNYKFTFSANNCAPRTYEITVLNGIVSGLEKGIKLHLYGDINGDGRINSSDVLKAKLQAKGSQKLTGYDFAVADVTKDGKVNSTDILKLKLHAKGSTKLW